MADDKEEVDTHDPHYDPIIQLPDKPVDTKTLEEDEDELLKLRAKLFRFDATEPPGEWKERGTGEVKLLRHKQTNRVRIVMRRDKTLKMCANHYITDTMGLIPSAGSDRAWVWHTAADFADGETKEERLAIRFANAENAQKFRKHFMEARYAQQDETGTRQQNGDGEANSSDSEEEDGEEKEADTSKDVKEGDGEQEKTESEPNEASQYTAADEVAEKLGDIQLGDNKETTDQTETESESSSDQKPKEAE